MLQLLPEESDFVFFFSKENLYSDFSSPTVQHFWSSQKIARATQWPRMSLRPRAAAAAALTGWPGVRSSLPAVCCTRLADHEDTNNRLPVLGYLGYGPSESRKKVLQ